MRRERTHLDRLADLITMRLVKETGITETQARDLIHLIGHDWPSLIREAKILAKSNRPA